MCINLDIKKLILKKNINFNKKNKKKRLSAT